MPSRDGLVRCDLDDMELLIFEIELPLPPLPELSSSEAEVAVLVGEGLSNAQIAGARGVSRRTVAGQLRSIYRKLSLRSRWALSLLLTRRAVALRARENINRSFHEEARYEPYGRCPTPREPGMPTVSMSELRRAVVALTHGRDSNERPADEALRQALAETDLAVRARMVIRSALAGGRIPRVADVAAALGVSVRSLQRQLRQERTTFRDLLTELRVSEAARRLDEGEPSREVARRLDYASAESLRRALRTRPD